MIVVFMNKVRQPLISTLFPYTTLFRSRAAADRRRADVASSPARAGRAPVGDRRAQESESDHQRLSAAPAGASAGRSRAEAEDRKSTRLNSSHANISYAVFCLKKKKLQT